MPPEKAAKQGRVDVHLVRGKPGAFDDIGLKHLGRLIGQPDIQRAVVVEARQRRRRLKLGVVQILAVIGRLDRLRVLQRRLGTTLVIVTHDMEEAVALGDRIAVMDKGRLLQYAPPAEILTHPATPFVQALIGSAERPFRLLSLTPVADLVQPGEGPGPAIPADASLRDALAECLWSGRDLLPVEGGGVVTLARLRERAEGAGAP